MKIQVNLKRLDLMMRACTTREVTSLMSCDGVQCSGPRGKQAKSYPLSDIIASSPSLPSSFSSLFSPVPSNPFSSIHPRHTPTAPPPSPPHTRPLKSALPAAATFPATTSATHLADPPFIRAHPWSFSIPRPHIVSPIPPTVHSSIVIRVPSTSTSNARAFPLLPIALGGPRLSPQSPSPIPVLLHAMTPSAASHRMRCFGLESPLFFFRSSLLPLHSVPRRPQRWHLDHRAS